MKTKLLLAFLFIYALSFAQSLPNPGMESWTSIPYNDPTPWYTSNRECLRKIGSANVTKVTGFSGFAARMETKMNLTDTVFGYVNHSPNDPTKDMGVPYSQKPTAINGYYRYNLPVNDTAILLVTFKKNNVVLSIDLFKIRGTGTLSAFTPFTYTLSVGAVPDTVIIAAASSNALSGVGIQNGSYLELDQLSFSGPGITQAIPGGNFDTWSTMSFDRPTSWYSWGDAFTKSTASYAGLYAASMQVIDRGGGNFDVAGMTNGVPSNTTTIGGSPFSSMNDTLTFYYKYTSPGLDTAGCYVNLKKNFVFTWGGGKKLIKSATYKFMKVPITPFSAPDSIIVYFTASDWSPNPHEVNGSNLWVDNIYYKSTLTGISESALINNETTVYPNPATTKLNIRVSAGVVIDKLEISIYDVTGKKVFSETKFDARGVIPLNIEELSAGMYYYTLTGGEIKIQSKFVKQ